MSTSAILWCALVAMFSLLYVKIHKHLNYWKNLGIACEVPNLLLGNVTGLDTRRSFPEIWLSYFERFRGTGPFAGFYWFQRRAVFVLEHELAKQILIKNFHNFTDRGFFSNPRDDPLTGHLFLLNGEKWRRLRNKFSPIFTSAKMKLMQPLMVDVANRLTASLAAITARNSVVEIKDLMSRYTTDVIGSCAFGLECNSLNYPSTKFHIMGVKSLTQHRHGRIISGFFNSFPDLGRKLRFKQTHPEVESFFLDLVYRTVAQREQQTVRRNDLMDMLIDLRNSAVSRAQDDNLSLDEMAAQAFVFLVAGFETSATTMSFALYELAQHQDIQEHARKEVLAILEKHKQDFSYECFKDMQYLQQVISETLRLYTVVPVMTRNCNEDFVVPWNPRYVIKRGMFVIIPAHAMHRDPTIYPNPLEFNPDNFTAEKVMARDSVLWLPFGDGPRNCIGMRFGQMETTIGLALLLKHFRFHICPQTIIPMEYDRRTFLVASKGGIFLRVERIES